MKVAVMGAGGVGGYVGGRLAQAGAEVALVARGPHLAALKERGLLLRGTAGEERVAVTAHGAPAEVGPVDLILFTVKLGDAEAAAGSLGPMIGPGTRVLTLQNGIDSRAILSRHVGAERVVEGVIVIAAYIDAPGVILHPGGVHRLTAERRAGDPVMDAFFDLAGKVEGLDILPSEDPKAMIWGKFVMLVALAGATCLTRAPVGPVLAHAESRAFLRALLEENIAVARAEGVSFPADHVEVLMKMVEGQPAVQKSSMLVDLEAGKPLELPWLSGRVCELAARHGIDAPANRAVVAALAPHVAGRAG